MFVRGGWHDQRLASGVAYCYDHRAISVRMRDRADTAPLSRFKLQIVICVLLNLAGLRGCGVADYWAILETKQSLRSGP